ncbi:hypothetical protein EYC84_007357 [Monilinia fructicola]|uniref:Uncharacterized protein n=1 Tax=Monilinia fructicola TaxID=38448 RepID=A0A5M9JGB0_MONFR|nr:hypothetical protein EYC84_007357 [Monilinia fructicola]
MGGTTFATRGWYVFDVKINGKIKRYRSLRSYHVEYTRERFMMSSNRLHPVLIRNPLLSAKHSAITTSATTNSLRSTVPRSSSHPCNELVLFVPDFFAIKPIETTARNTKNDNMEEKEEETTIHTTDEPTASSASLIQYLAIQAEMIKALGSLGKLNLDIRHLIFSACMTDPLTVDLLEMNQVNYVKNTSNITLYNLSQTCTMIKSEIESWFPSQNAVLESPYFGLFIPNNTTFVLALTTEEQNPEDDDDARALFKRAKTMFREFFWEEVHRKNVRKMRIELMNPIQIKHFAHLIWDLRMKYRLEELEIVTRQPVQYHGIVDLLTQQHFLRKGQAARYCGHATDESYLSCGCLDWVVWVVLPDNEWVAELDQTFRDGNFLFFDCWYGDAMYEGSGQGELTHHVHYGASSY